MRNACRSKSPKIPPCKRTNINKLKTPQPNLPKSKLDNLPPNNGKDRMPPMERQPSDPLKQMRQKQATTAKLLVAQNIQRA
jgi:hypothetical protein